MKNAKWFTPARMLAIFCCMNILVYIDRGALSSNEVNGTARTAENPEGTGIQGQFSLSLFYDGLLSSAFMVGLLIACPIFAELAKYRNAFRLIGVGQLVWCVGVVATGLSYHYSILIISRMFVGVGEASFITLAAPFIDDNAPTHLKSLWLSLFYMCCPAGYAMGYIVGGIIADVAGWRSVFFIEAIAMSPFVIFGFCARPIDLKRSVPTERDVTIKGAIVQFLKDVRILFSHHVYTMSVVGYTLLIGVLGVYSYFGPRAGRVAFSIPGGTADLIFGITTVFTGIAGTVLGGLILDWRGSTIYNAMMINGVGMALACITAIIAFGAIYSIYGFVPMLALCEVAIFIPNAPVIAVQLWTVPVALRPLAAAISTVCIHIFGDVPAPPIVGAVQEFLAARMSPGAAWRVAMGLSSAVFGVSAIFMFAGAFLAKHARDYRKQEESRQQQEAEEEESLVTELGPYSNTDITQQH